MTLHSSTSLDTLRVDHIGSLVRPSALLEVHARLDGHTDTEDALRRAEDEAIKEVVSQQEGIGFPVVNDGEFRRRNFQDSFGAAVSGFDVTGETSDYRRWQEESRSTRSERVLSGPAVAGPPVRTRRAAVHRLELTRNLPLEEYRFAAGVARKPVKVTLIGPDRVSQRFDYQNSRDVYDGLDDFTRHVAAMEQEMVAQLVEAGCPYVQIDAPGYTAYVDPTSLGAMRARGEDPDENLARSLKADNAVIDGFTGVTFGIHLCRGNSRAIDPATGKFVPQWHREGHYDAIAERLFNTLRHQRFLLEYDSERSGSFEALRFVPRDKIVVLGLVTTKSTDIETVDMLMRRVEEATRYVPVDQLALSPQCGFGSSAAESIPAEAQWKKLEVILETASKIWG